MIPQEKSAAVAQGLRVAFGVTVFEEIRAVSGGHTSSLVFRIVVQGAPYLLKIILRTDDPTRHYICMKAAAEAGLAPRVWYTSVEDRISITDFVQTVPLPVEEAVVRLPHILRSLHALPSFPRVADHFNTSCVFLLNKGPVVEGLIQKFQTANALPKDESSELLAHYKQVAAIYPLIDADMVSSHNDLFKPDNFLFDGQAVLLVDWETAFLNDRYADLAVVAHLCVTNDMEEKIYLQEYFGKPPDEYQLARFFLMQQLSLMFYAMIFLMMGSSDKPIDHVEDVPPFRDFHRRIWSGEITLTDSMKPVYGRVYARQLFQNLRSPRYKEALRIVAGRRLCV